MGVVLSWGTGETYGMGYGSFDGLQRRLAAAINIDLDQMEGHGGSTKWDKFKDPLVPFLRQNCDGGALSPQDCFLIRQRIWQLTQNWPTEDRDGMRNFASFLAEAAFVGGWLRWR